MQDLGPCGQSHLQDNMKVLAQPPVRNVTASVGQPCILIVTLAKEGPAEVSERQQ